MKKKIVYYALANSGGEFFYSVRSSWWFSDKLDLNDLYKDPNEAAGAKYRITKNLKIEDLHVKPITISWE
jgi:hypothetical protein